MPGIGNYRDEFNLISFEKSMFLRRLGRRRLGLIVGGGEEFFSSMVIRANVHKYAVFQLKRFAFVPCACIIHEELSTVWWKRECNFKEPNSV